WLVARPRDRRAALTPVPSWRGLLLLLPLAVGWLAGDRVEVTGVRQLCLVTMLRAGTWAILGDRVAGAIAFPLGFLFLAVPMGEGFVRPLQEFTAVTTVRLVEMSGIPVFRDGLHFSLPSGDWKVVEACSGVRYLIASLTLGVLFAYLNFNRWPKRLLFVAVAIVLPIFANALRAYLLVMLGHVSNGALGTGTDHMVYGWIVFGLVMFLLFWFGARWADPPEDECRIAMGERSSAAAGRRMVPLFTVMALVLAAGPRLLLVSHYGNLDSNPPALMPLQSGGFGAADA
ncbi:MAG: exosortase A, partial [Parahaliea sp.]